MAKIDRKYIIEKFGPPNYVTASGQTLMYFKHMICIKKVNNRYKICFLRDHGGTFQYYNEEKDTWIMTLTQKGPRLAYDKFINDEIDEILLDAPTESIEKG